MLLRLEAEDPRPLHEQVAAALRRAIADGGAPERLPTARDLAAAFEVDPNTVLRALRGLRDEGLLEFRRGRGIRVVPGAGRRSEFVDRVRELVRDAEKAGHTRADLIAMIEEM
ncbi:GntR family transcriptional regulator [Actinocorallia sp. B10E7]|uniref:GntR family transcriptional regulator n=1 Tax=Actinocorallia sp. B10E7 TaxID=3153558 RepID=UPI00325F5F17